MSAARRSRWCVAAAVAVLLIPQLIPQRVAAQAAPRIAMPAWMAGCWEHRTGDRLVEEHWVAPRGGLMLGSGRTTRGDSVVEYEQTRISATGDTLIFAAQPSGQPAAEFRAIGPAGDEVRFENLAHDFPQRVIYRRAGADSLVARVEGMRRGQLRAFDFPYGRVACPGSREARR